MKPARIVVFTTIVGCMVHAPAAHSADLSGLLQQFASTVHGWSDLDTRLSNLASQINQARTNGSLTPSQANDFNTQVQKIKLQETQAQATGARMSFTEMFSYTNAVNVLANQVNQAMQAQQSSVPDVDAYQAQLKKQISDAHAAGQLTQQDADKLGQDLRSVADMEAGFKSTSDGTLNPRQADLLVKSLDRVKASIIQQIAASQSAIPELRQRRDALTKKILDATKSGGLNEQQATSFNSEMAQIAATQQGYAGQGTISGAEIYSLATSMDKLEAKIDQTVAAHNSVPPVTVNPPNEIRDLNTRREGLAKKIADATAAGSITSQQSTDLNSDVAQIYATQQSYSGQGNLSGSQVYNLMASMDRLANKIDQTMAARTIAIASNQPSAGGYPDARGGNPDAARGGYPDARGGNPDAARGGYPDARSGSPDAARGGFSDARGGNPDAARGGYPDARGGNPDAARGGYPDTRGGNPDAARGGYPDTRGGNPDAARGGYPDARGGSPDVARGGYPDARGGSPDVARGGYPGTRGGYRANGTGFDNGDQSGMNSGQLPPVAINQAPVYTSEQPTPSYKDVIGYWGEPYISGLASRGIIGGFPDGTFKPNDQITRAQFAAIATKAMSLPTGGSASFRDVSASYWANGVIGAVSSAGLVTGFPDGTFRPEDKLTRAQALIILVKALGNSAPDPNELSAYSDASDVPAWAQPSISAAAGAHIIVNYPDPSLIRPNDLATRGEVAALTYQTLLRLGKNLPRISIGVLHPQANRR